MMEARAGDILRLTHPVFYGNISTYPSIGDLAIVKSVGEGGFLAKVVFIPYPDYQLWVSLRKFEHTGECVDS
jgi:hypothetical protein